MKIKNNKHLKEHQITVYHGARPTYPRLKECGHRFDPRNHPRQVNCEKCWYTYFSVQAGQAAAAMKVTEAFGEGALSEMFGKKGAKFFRRFAAQVQIELTKTDAPVEIPA